MSYKLNAKSDKNRVLNEQILGTLSESGYDVDRFGHATKTSGDGTKYRYKFQATGIRYECQVIHEASKYSPASKSWVRIKTIPYSKLKAKS